MQCEKCGEEMQPKAWSTSAYRIHVFKTDSHMIVCGVCLFMMTSEVLNVEAELPLPVLGLDGYNEKKPRSPNVPNAM